MDIESKQEFIRSKASQNQVNPEGEKILWSRHDITKLVDEGWSRAAVEAGLQRCLIVEDYPHLHRQLPDCLVLGWLTLEEPFHSVIAIDKFNDRLFIVTVYRPTPEEWHDGWRERKS